MTSRTARRSTRFKASTAVAWLQKRFDFGRDASVNLQAGIARQFLGPTIEEAKFSTSITIRIGRIAEAIMDQMILEIRVAMLAVTNIVSSH